MSNGWAKFSSVIAWISLISGIIGGIILAVDIAWYYALFGIIGGLISLCLFGTLGYVADKVSEKTEETSQVRSTASVTLPFGETSSTHDTTNNSEEPVIAKKETIISATSFTNLFRNNYNVKVFLDGNLLGIVPSGGSEAFHSDPLEGTHMLLLEKEDDGNVYASREIESSGARSIRIGFSGKSDRISIDYIKTF